MFRRFTTTLVVLVLAGTLAALGWGVLGLHDPLVLAAAPGSSPDSALPVPSGPVIVPVGQRVWYGFQYAGDGSPILVDMSADPGGSANFGIWTSGNVQSWASGQAENPVGRGSTQYRTHRNSDGSVDQTTLFNGDLIWDGSFRIPGKYYVVVDQAGPNPATINLKVTGSAVSAIPGPAAPAGVPAAVSAQATLAPTAAPACAPAAPVVRLSAIGAGSGLNQAIPLPSSSTYILPVGQRAWYAFQYSGDGSQILIDLRSTPDNSATFGVYTPANTTTPVGRGSQEVVTRVKADGTTEETTLYGGDQIWSGSFRSPGTYYVAVDQTGANPSTITLGINGTGVSGGQAMSALPSSAQPGPACVPQPTATPAPGTLSAAGAGSGPNQAIPLPSSSTYLLPVGQRAWYAFQYNGDGSQILLDLRSTPDNSATFGVYTPANTTTPVGRGSQQILTRAQSDGTTEETTLYGGDQIWSGSFRSPGTYYVAVDQKGTNPSTITLTITGTGVSAPPAG